MLMLSLYHHKIQLSQPQSSLKNHKHLPVSRLQWCPLNSCRKRASSWDSESPPPLYSRIWLRNAANSSYRPNKRPEFSHIKEPIFSNDESSTNHAGSSSREPHLFLISRSNSTKCRKRVDFPLPVGIHRVSQRRIGSDQSVLGTSTTAGDKM